MFSGYIKKTYNLASIVEDPLATPTMKHLVLVASEINAEENLVIGEIFIG